MLRLRCKKRSGSRSPLYLSSSRTWTQGNASLNALLKECQVEQSFRSGSCSQSAQPAPLSADFITTVSWTELTTESYITITCHFIADGKVNSYVVQIQAMEERHSIANLAIKHL